MEKAEIMTEGFQRLCCPFGYADIKKAMEIAIDVGMIADDVYDIVAEYCEDTETKFEDADVCAILLDHILQQARNQIDIYTGFDLENDAYFSVYGNYMSSEFICDEEKKGSLLKELKKLSKEDINDLLNNKYVRYFLSEIDLMNKLSG